MIADELLALLRCPESMQPLAFASAGMIAHLEKARVAGSLRDRAGNVVRGPLEQGLVREDETLFFPIRDGIPVLLLAEAIPVPARPTA